MKLILQASTLLLPPLALALPTSEVPEEPAVPIPKESTVPVPVQEATIPPCQQVCPPEWAPVCAQDEYDNIVIFSSFCLFYNANCGRQRYILGRMEDCIEPGENTPIPPMVPVPFTR